MMSECGYLPHAIRKTIAEGFGAAPIYFTFSLRFSIISSTMARRS